MKIAGLDVGSKTIGFAVSDPFGWTAQGITTIQWNEKDIYSADVALRALFAEHNVEKVVVGYPKHMNGSVGERGIKSEKYAQHIEKRMKVPTILWDERLSTSQAERTLLEADMSREKRGKIIDQVAASVILQGYLDANSRGVT